MRHPGRTQIHRVWRGWGYLNTGSHLFMRHPDGRTTLITFHPGENIGKGMIRKIISDAKLTRDEWLELIESL